MYYATEILASYASLARGADYPAALLDEAAENRRKKGDPEIRVEGKGIALLSMKRIGAEIVIRLYNADCEKKKATLRVAGDQMEFSFNPYEVKSAVYGAHGLQPCEPWKA